MSQQPQQHLPQSPVVVVGGAVVDVIFRARPGPRSSAAAMAGTSVPGALLRRSLGGAGRNICEALARCGAGPLRFASVVGDDPDGRYVRGAARDALNPAGRGTASTDVDIAVIPGATTATYVALLDGTGELAAAVAAMDIFDAHLTPQWLAGHPGLLDAIRGARCLVLDGNVPTMALRAMGVVGAELPPGATPLVALDPIGATKALRLEPALRGLAPRKGFAFLLKPNAREAAELAAAIRRDEGGAASIGGHLAPPEPHGSAATAELAVCCRRILRATGVDVVLCTAGPHGAVVAVKLGGVPAATGDAGVAAAGPQWALLERGLGGAPALAVTLVPAAPLAGAAVVKVTGCGDTFLACATASLLRSGHWADAVVAQGVRGVAGAAGDAAVVRCLAALRRAAEAGARGARLALLTAAAIPAALTPAILDTPPPADGPRGPSAPPSKL